MKSLSLIRSMNILSLLKETYLKFSNDNGLKMSAALSYYTIFSLPPLLMIIISLSGLFFGDEAVRGHVFSQLSGLVGAQAALDVQEILKNVKISQNNIATSVISAVVLLVTASGVFAEIQDSMNYIWGLEAKPKRGLIKMIMNRLMSFSMVASVGFLLLVGLVLNALMDILSNRILLFFHNEYVLLFNVLNNIFMFLIVTLLFVVVYKTLPDGKIALKDGLIGAAITALFFMLGKFAIGFYMGHSSIASMYGTSASVVIILLWVYYSAIILYFGAELTKVYSSLYGKEIIPNKYAVLIRNKK